MTKYLSACQYIHVCLNYAIPKHSLYSPITVPRHLKTILQTIQRIDSFPGNIHCSVLRVIVNYSSIL